MKCLVSNTQHDDYNHMPPHWVVIPMSSANKKVLYDLQVAAEASRKSASLADIEVHADLPQVYFTDSYLVGDALHEEIYDTILQVIDINVDTLHEEEDGQYNLCSGRVKIDTRHSLIAYHYNNHDWQSSPFDVGDFQ